jgi:hypothetical protein
MNYLENWEKMYNFVALGEKQAQHKFFEMVLCGCYCWVEMPTGWRKNTKIAKNKGHAATLHCHER